jgi:hypothetical protein
MPGIVHAGDWIVLDQSPECRRNPTPEHLYLLRMEHCGLLRWLRATGTAVYSVAEDVRANPTAWDRLTGSAFELPRVVRARVYRIVLEQQWERAEPAVMPPARRPPRSTPRVPVPQSVAS